MINMRCFMKLSPAIEACISLEFFSENVSVKALKCKQVLYISETLTIPAINIKSAASCQKFLTRR